MAEETVGLKITATDVTQAAFGAVKAGLNGLTKATDALKTKFGDLGTLLSAGIAFKAFQTFVDGANDGIGAMNRFEASFKGVSDEATKMQENLVENFALTDDGAAALLTKFNSMFVSMGMSKQGALGLSGSMSTLAVDMANFAHVPVEQTMQDLSVAMMGNTKALRDYGIVIDDAKIKQEALAQGLGDTKGDLTSIEKAFVMQTLVMREAKDMIGQTAKAQDTYQVSSAKFKAGLNEAADSIGNFLLPKLNDIFKMFSILPGAVKVLVVAIPPLIAAIAALGGPVTAVVAAITALTYAASQIYKAFKQDNEETLEYITNLKDMAKAQEILPRLIEKVEAAEKIKNAHYQEAMKTNDQYAWAAYDKTDKEIIQLKGLRNLLQQKIADHDNEIAKVQKERDAVLLAEAQKAQALQKGIDDATAAREKAIKDAETAATKEKDRQVKIQEFIKEGRLAIVKNEFDEKRARLEVWYNEELILLQGNKEALMLLEQQHSQGVTAIAEEETAKKLELSKTALAAALAEEDRKRQARNNTASSFAANMATIASQFKEAFFISKAASIADATMKGWEGAQNSYTWGTAIGGPILGGIMAGVAAAAAAINVGNIAMTPPPFQTAYDQVRTVPGASNTSMLATLHGGETVSRKGSSGITIQVQGNIFNADETLEQIAEGLRYYQKQTGFNLSIA